MEEELDIREELYNIAADRVGDSGELEFLIDLMCTASELGEYWYFNSILFKKHCQLSQLHEDHVRVILCRS